MLRRKQTRTRLIPGRGAAVSQVRVKGRSEGIISFAGKSILVTGAGSGIGAACVRRLFGEGATVIAVDVTEEGRRHDRFRIWRSDRVQGAMLDVAIMMRPIQLVADVRKRSAR